MKFLTEKKVTYAICCAIIILTVIIFHSNCTVVNAVDMKEIYNVDTSNTGTFGEIGGKGIWMIQAIGVAVAVIMIAYIGLKYILSSPDGKADLKKQMIGYFIGAFLIASGSTVATIIANIAYDNI